MSLAVVTGQHGAAFPGTSGTSQALTLTNPVGAGNAVVIFGGAELGNTLTITDDKGNTWPAAVRVVSDTPNDFTAASFLLGNISNGPKTFTVHSSGPSAFGCAIWVAEIGGALAASNPIDGENGQLQNSVGTGAGAITSGSFSPTTAALVIGWTTVTDASIAISSFTGFTALDNIATVGLDEWLVLGAAGSTAAQFTAGTAGGSWITLAMGIQPSATDVLMPQIWL